MMMWAQHLVVRVPHKNYIKHSWAAHFPLHVLYASAERGFTLHHSVWGFHRRQVGDDSDIVVSAGALDVDVDGALDLAVEARYHACGICHVGQAALAVVSRGEKRLQLG